MLTSEEAKKILIRKIMFQALAFSLTFCNYATLHASRAAWSNATPQIKKKYPEEFGAGHIINYINSAYLICYASVGIVSGHFSDRFGKNKGLFILIAHLAIGINVMMLGCLQYLQNQQIWLFFFFRIIDGTL